MAWAIITIYTSKFALMDTQQLLKTSKYYSTCKKCDIEKPIGGVNPHPWQRCHSKKIKNPRRATEKTQKTPGQISMQLAYILGKNPTFPGKNPTFSKENCLFSAKISDYFFLVISSKF